MMTLSCMSMGLREWRVWYKETAIFSVYEWRKEIAQSVCPFKYRSP